jgi:hypothetical protein
MDEKLKQPLMIGVMTLAVTVTIYQFWYYFTLERGTGFTFLGVMTGVLAGLVLGGIAFGIAYAALKNQ